MARLLTNEPKAINAVADILYSAGRYLEAAQYYARVGQNESGALIKQARSLFMGGEAQKTLELLESAPDKSSLSFQELYLDCLKMVHPESKEIPSLDRHVLHLKVEDALDREIMDQTGRSALEPIVHGERS